MEWSQSTLMKTKMTTANNNIILYFIYQFNLLFDNQVALLTDKTANDNGFLRTAVHRNSHRPYFNHRFTFDLCYDEMARIQSAVWHRNREFK